MEYVPGKDLFHYIYSQKNKKLSKKTSSKIFRQIINTLEYIHKLGVVHRDIKLQNILCCSNFIVKICEFGLAKIIKKEDKDLHLEKSTWIYQGPESYINNYKMSIKDSFNQDYFSLGII